MKFNTDIERGKLQRAIRKKRDNFSKSIKQIFHKSHRDLDIIRINLLSLLEIFPVVSLRQLKGLTSFQHGHILQIHKLQRAGCVNSYNKYILNIKKRNCCYLIYTKKV